MSYYIVATDTGKIVEITNVMNEFIIQQLANEFACAVHAILGQHSGFSAVPKRADDTA